MGVSALMINVALSGMDESPTILQFQFTLLIWLIIVEPTTADMDNFWRLSVVPYVYES